MNSFVISDRDIHTYTYLVIVIDMCTYIIYFVSNNILKKKQKTRKLFQFFDQ